MSPSSNYISLILFTTLLLPLHTIARDSEFFSKVTHFNKETQIPNKQESTTTVTNKPEDQQPSFIPQTENSYGLYGHDSSDHLPTTAATNSEFENNNKYYNNDAYKTKYYNKDPFGNSLNELSDTKYNGEGYNYNSMMEKQNNNERPFHNNNNINNNNYYNVEKQGMSDTRFLEGGKYFHDINSEKYNPTMYGDSYSRGVNPNNWYHNNGNSYNTDNNANNNGYNNGNTNGYNNEYYQNNHGSYNGYKNQAVNQFEDEQNEFEP